MKKLTFTSAISGQWPCQIEGYIVATNEPYYFRQRGQSASLRIFDKPLGKSLDNGDSEFPKELAKYTVEVEPLTSDAENCPEEILATMMTLLAMHEQAIAASTAEQ